MVYRYYEQQKTLSDPAHAAIASMASLQDRLKQIRRDLMGCCSVDINGLVVVDPSHFETLDSEQNLIAGKIESILKFIEERDKVFRSASEQNIGIGPKTLDGIRDKINTARLRCENRYMPHEEYQKSYNSTIKPLAILLKKAENICSEYQNEVK